MSFSVGIVGLPNIGKSTIFKALTRKQVDASNYPFCTIDPNIGVVTVPDKRLDRLAEVEKSAKIIPTVIEFVDIAGLVKNAHKGEGLGNQFLANIREVDAIVQVLRYFKDENVIHVDNRIDPMSDMRTVNLELIMADLQTVEKRLEKASKEAKGQDKDAIILRDLLIKIQEHLNQEKLLIDLGLDKEEDLLIKNLNLLTNKPFLYILNISEDQVNEALPDNIKKIEPVLICAKTESELADLSEDEAKEYLIELNINITGLDQLIKQAYQKLNLITFFTAGEKETRAWTVVNNSKAPQAAGKVHTDFEKGFIRAEVVNWEILIKAGSWNKAKELGKVTDEGKEYITQDGDVMIFKYSL